MHFFNIVPLAPMRAEASHRSEMVNQLLFGEFVEFLSETVDFIKVKTNYEGYEGWVQKSQLAKIRDNPVTPIGYVSNRDKTVLVNGKPVTVTIGAPIYSNDSLVFDQGLYQIDYRPYDITVVGSLPGEIPGQAYLGTAYLWGGKSPWGVDCSGFVQQVYKMNGHYLPRDAWQQALEGQTLDFLAEAKTGDLAFFDNAEGRITHVGIMIGNDRIIHSSGDVHIDPIDTFGIVHHVTGKRTHQLRMVKRMVSREW